MQNNKLYILLSRNKYGLNGVARKNKVNLEWWKKETNLGDAISPIIVAWMLRRENINIDKNISKTIHLLGVGSLIGNERFDATVWGSGILSYDRTLVVDRQRKYRKYDVRAVRGPLTKLILEYDGYQCPDVIGDPAILMPLIYMPKDTEKKYGRSFIFHHSVEPSDLQLWHIINIKTNDYKFFLDDLVASEVVISSSLHGIILAESYGVPTIWLSEGVDRQFFKFYDWYYSTGRYSVKMARTFDEALAMEPMPLPELNKMRDGLMAAFPYDLWE